MATTSHNHFPKRAQHNTTTRYRDRGRRSSSSHARRQQQQQPSGSSSTKIAILKCVECNNNDNDDEAPKYKCPKCRAPYCSVACCRAHKEKNCGAAAEEPPRKKSKYLPPSSDLLMRDPIENAALQRKLLDDNDDDPDNDDLDYKITKEMMTCMDQSDWLRNELQDGGLRQLIHQVVSASNTVMSSSTRTREGATATTTHQEDLIVSLQAKHVNFHVFLDKLKVLTGVLERQVEDGSGGETEDLRDWLEHTNRMEDLGPLALKSLPSSRKNDLSRLPPICAPPKDGGGDSDDSSDVVDEETSSSSSSDDDDDESESSSESD